METSALGNSGLKVSRIAFGCGTISGHHYGSTDDSESIAALQKAFELGINFYDTADIYGLGHSECLLQKALGSRLKETIVSTKFGIRWDSSKSRSYRDSSPEWLFQALNDSLKRLKIESIPLYFIHAPDPDTPLEKTLQALCKAKEAGKILHIGLSNFSLEELKFATSLCQITAVQYPYNLAERTIEKDILSFCKNTGISVLCYSPLAHGIFSNNFSTKSAFSGTDCRQRYKEFQGASFKKNLELADKIRQIAEKNNRLPSQIAIRWILNTPKVTSAITGIRTPKQIEENVGALDWNLSKEDLDFLQVTKQ